MITFVCVRLLLLFLFTQQGHKHDRDLQVLVHCRRGAETVHLKMMSANTTKRMLKHDRDLRSWAGLVAWWFALFVIKLFSAQLSNH